MLLIHSEAPKLAELLMGCRSYLDVSNTFGSRSWSMKSIFQIHAPLKQFQELKKLNHYEKAVLHTNVKLIYPTQDSAPEIVEVEIFPDVNLISDNELVQPEKLKNLDSDYIKDQIRKCTEKIEAGDLDGSITNARTLVESTCLFILEKESSEDVKHDGDLPKLYKKVAVLLKMDASLYDDNELKKIISGSFSIVTGIAALRNAYSDSHAHNSVPKYRMNKHHAVLIVNLSKSISEFLYSSWEEKRNR